MHAPDGQQQRPHSTSAPTARPIPAWGIAPGQIADSHPSAIGASYTRLGHRPRSDRKSHPSANGAPYTSLGHRPRSDRRKSPKRQRRVLYQPGASPQVRSQKSPKRQRRALYQPGASPQVRSQKVTRGLKARSILSSCRNPSHSSRYTSSSAPKTAPRTCTKTLRKSFTLTLPRWFATQTANAIVSAASQIMSISPSGSHAPQPSPHLFKY